MKRLVIIGGGFSGSYIAKKLQYKFNITLIDPKEFFEFTPGIYGIIGNFFYKRKIQVLFDKILTNVNIITGKVLRVDLNAVYTKTHVFPFDYLVIASGSGYSCPFSGDNVILPNCISNLNNIEEKINDSKGIIIVGAGPVGIELSTEIRDFNDTVPITLLQSNKVILPRNSPQTRKTVAHYLQKNNIQVFCNSRIDSFDGFHAYTETGDSFEGDLLFYNAGFVPNTSFLGSEFPLDRRNHIDVKKSLQLRGYPNIFASGDITNINEEKTAHAAEEHAKIIVKNLKRLNRGWKLIYYIPKISPMALSLGRKNGVYESSSSSFSGKIVLLLKKIIEFKVLWKYRF